MDSNHTPMAQVAEEFVFLLRKQEDGTRWPVGIKLYAESPLIAAAPELLEALILLEAEMVASGNAQSRDFGWRPAIEKTRAAIAKALGSAS